MNNLISFSSFTTVLLAGVFTAGCASAPPTIQTGPDAEVTYDGLHRVNNSQADQAWARPGFDLSGYSKIMLVGGGIAYRPVDDKARTTRGLSGGEPYFIDEGSRARFEALVSQKFREELQEIERFTIVDNPGPDVMTVRGGLLDVVSYVPPEQAGRSDVYLSSVGEATLILELRDSETGAILARSVDRRAAEPISGSMRISNRATNNAEVSRLIRFWARRLREGLDGFGQ